MAGWQDRVSLGVEWGTRGTQRDDDGVWQPSDPETETLWDGSRTWSGIEPTWITLSDCVVSGFSSRRGRSRATQGFAVGTATVEILETESVVEGPVPGSGWSWRSEISIGDELRVRAYDLETGFSANLFRGDIRSLADAWSPDGRHGLTLHLTDILGRLGRIDLPEREPTGGGDRSGERMGRIADLAEIPPSRRRFDPGTMILQPSTFARNLAGEADVTVVSEGGDLFAQRDGRLAFRQRQWWRTDPRTSVPRIVWSNTPVLPPPGIPVACPVNVDTAVSLDLVENQISYARTGGSAITVRDPTSRSLYGLSTFQRLDLLNVDDDDVESLAAFRLAESSSRIRIVDGIHINPLGDPESWSGVLDLELGDLHRLVWFDGDETTDLLVHVQGIEYRITPESWRTVLQVWDRYGFSPAAGWDVAEWDVSLWS